MRKQEVEFLALRFVQDGDRFFVFFHALGLALRLENGPFFKYRDEAGAGLYCSCQLKRRQALVINVCCHGIVCATVKQEMNQFPVAIGDRTMKRRHVFLVGGIGIGTGIKQDANHIHLAIMA